jgi:XTP/dITP diphosphohydrolase
MALPSKLALATKNPGKIKEILEICADWPVSWLTAEDADWPDIEETGETYRENALLKAMEVARVLGVPAVADDSGIEVDALGGGPGPRSARFAGEHASDSENLALLMARIGDVPEAQRTARYRCVAACAWPEGQAIDVEETCEGHLVLSPRGSGGFGYDPAFVPDGYDQTMAELSAPEKNRISHRGKALRALGEALRAGQ